MNTTNLMSALHSGTSFVCVLAQKMLGIRTFKDRSNNNEINEILLYGAENENHMQQIGLNNLLCINYVILHANNSVDVCVPSFASDTLAKSLINVHQKDKVKIRIVIHNSDDFHNLQLFAQNGIEVKIINSVVELEHDFLLIDASEEFKDAVAVIGSLDYDTSRVNCNRDATVLTSEAVVVKALKREFDRVWNSVSDVRYPKNDKDK